MNILDFSILEEKGFLNTYVLKNETSNALLTNIYELNFLELPKVPKEIDPKKYSKKELWALFLALENREGIQMLKENNDKTINNAIEKLIYISSNDKARMEYERREDAKRDYISSMNSAESRGIEKGRVEGIEKGIEKVAKEMLSKGLEIDLIAEITKLSKDEINKLKH